MDQKEVYLQILDALADMVLVKGADSRIAWANRAFREYYGMSNEQLRDMIDAPFNEVDYTAQYVRDDLHVFTTGETLNIPDEPVTRHDGVEQIFHTVKSPIRDADGRVRMTVGVSRNITEQKRNQEELDRYRDHLERLVGERTAELKAVSERLQIILASLVEGIVALDAHGRVQMLNPAAEALTGWTSGEAHGRVLNDVVRFQPEVTRPSGDGAAAEDLLDRVLRSGQRVSGWLETPSGSRRLISLTGAPLTGNDGALLGSVLVIRDIALEREVEAQRLRQQKLETVGVLAGGIAHDFNNILTGILGSISLARLKGKAGQDPDTILEEAERACFCAQKLTNQLLTFSKGGAPVKRILRVEPPVRRAAELALRGSSIKLSLRCAPDVWPVDADDGQLEQAINNIVLNAKQAQPEGGEVTISIGNETVVDESRPPLRPGRHVFIAVEDAGGGIAPEHLPRVFEPYFTTKDHGTGLGLASVHSIVERHGGQVVVSSRLGEGACFTIYLPAAPEGAVAEAADVSPTGGRSGRKLLILDDDQRVRRVLGSMLESLGQTVVTTGTSSEAFFAFQDAQRRGEPFDAAIIDLTMPGDLGGAAVVERLREFDPEVKIVVMSGYSVDPVMAKYRELRLTGTLQKPFDLRALRVILDRC